MSKLKRFRAYWRWTGYVEVMGHPVGLPFGIKAFAYHSTDKLREAIGVRAYGKNGWVVCDIETGASIVGSSDNAFSSMGAAIKAARAMVVTVGLDKYKRSIEKAFNGIRDDVLQRVGRGGSKESPNG